jgi:Protein of unknown function (DUF3105)
VPPKKARTPRPPKVQAPKTRATPRDRDDRRARMILYALGGSGVLALAIVLIVIATAGGGGGGTSVAAVQKAMSAAGCTFKTVKGDSIGHHVTKLTAKIKYNTFPPSSGTHYYQPAVWDFYTEPVNPIQVVHNEEHGGVIIWWGEEVSPATIEQLRRFYLDSPVSMLGTPIKGLGSKVALTAWTKDKDGIHGRVATCPKFDETAFKAFRDAFRGKSPEGIPESVNQPGT